MSAEAIRQEFEQNGLLHLAEFLSAEEVKDLKENLKRYVRDIARSVPPDDRALEGDGRTIRKLWRMEKHDEFFNALAYRRDVMRFAQTLLGATPVLMGVETFNQGAKIGAGVPPHQDNATLCQKPADALTIWLPVNTATKQNPPAYYLKGSHTAGVLAHGATHKPGDPLGLLKVPPHTAADKIHGPLSPGDALIVHCQTVHWNMPNKTDKPRCAVALIYRGTHTADDPELKAVYEKARSATKK